MGEIKQAYIEELEQRLSDWWNEIGALEARMKKANAESGHQMFIEIQALRKRRDETKAMLQTLRETDHPNWEGVKEELEKGWRALRSGLDKMAQGFTHEWDERDS